jgi:hypothetical protein
VADTSFAVTAGSGTLLHSVTTSIGGSMVHNEVVTLGEQYLATYTTFFSTAAAAASSDKHPFELMAGASLKLRIREITFWQQAASAAGTMMAFEILRLTTAGTGGTSRAVAALDPADAAAGATLMQTPTAEGTEGAILLVAVYPTVTTLPNLAPAFSWKQLPNAKPIVVAAGTSNGIGLSITTGGGTGTTIRGYIVFDESNF